MTEDLDNEKESDISDDVSSDEAALAPTSAPQSAILRALQRLHDVLDAESDFLQGGFVGNFDEIIQRKSQCLLDLERLSRTVDASILASEEGRIKEEVERTRQRLVENEDILSRYLKAVQEVSEIVNNSLRDEEADGTYSEMIPFGRYGR